MRPLRIDFVDDQKWRVIWFITGTLLALMLVAYQFWAYQNAQRQNELRQELESLQAEGLAQVSGQALDKRRAHALAMAKLLQTDYNKVFQTLETLKQPGIRLRQLQIDATSRKVRVEYEFENLDQISVISGHLNSGYTNPPWQFEGSSVSSSPSLGGNFAAMGDQRTTRGTWSCAIDAL